MNTSRDKKNCLSCPDRNECKELCPEIKEIIDDPPFNRAQFVEIPFDSASLERIIANKQIAQEGDNDGLEQLKALVKLLKEDIIFSIIDDDISDKQKEIIIMYFFAELTEMEMGGILERAQQTVGEGKALALQKIRKRYDDITRDARK